MDYIFQTSNNIFSETQDIIVACAKLKDLTKRATAAADELDDEEKKNEFLAEIENAIRN